MLNETLLAIVIPESDKVRTDVGDNLSIELRRISDLKVIHQVNIFVQDYLGFLMGRFNLFLRMKHNLRVFDLRTLECLHHINTMQSNSLTSPFYLADNDLLFLLECDPDPDESAVAVTFPPYELDFAPRLYCFDPVARTKYCVLRREDPLAYGPGYFVNIMEYPVDENGRRTGQLGRSKVYFRELGLREVESSTWELLHLSEDGAVPGATAQGDGELAAGVEITQS
ncbi:hypothetical protein HDV00_004191 [Rhizophlyctis rosea]|nr:hypothetical protein HDV00_004191 [Rhizophlyctis rosea]